MKNLLYQVRLVKQNPGLRFLTTVIFLYIIWEVILQTWFLNSPLSYGLCEILGRSSGFFYSLLGYETNWSHPALTLNGQKVINIGLPCNGLEFFGLFTCFVIAFPGKLKSKIWFLPFGILFIHILNMVRVQFLIMNYYYFESSFSFNHKYTFNVLIYGCTLLLWLFWAKRNIKQLV